MGRVANILGRIIRQANKRTSSGNFESTDGNMIYDEMNEAQKAIYAEVIIEKSFDITMVTDQEDYILASAVASVDCIRNIKEFIQPSAWDIPIAMADNKDWESLKQSDISDVQPLYATVFEKTLKLYPVNGVDGETLEAWAYLRSPTTTLSSSSTDPELSGIWDKAIEYFVLAQILDGEDSRYFFALFKGEIEDKGATEHIKRVNTVRDTEW